MDLDDFDELDAPKPAPTRAPKFAPKDSKFKPQPKRKPAGQQASVTRPEPQKPTVPVLIKEDDEDIKPNLDTEVKVKAEPIVSNAAGLKMEVDVRQEAREEDDHMDVDRGEEDEGEEEDVIVREIDVFATPSIDPNTQIYVLQYPLRPRWRPYELDERCREVRVKPSTAEVEIDISIDNSMNWDEDYASTLKMAKRTLSSVWEPPAARAGYAVGVLIGNKLYFNPVKAASQLRPSLKHYGSYDSNMKCHVGSDVDDTIKQEDSTPGKRASSSKTQSKQTDTTNGQALDAEGSWVPLKYHESKSDLSNAYLEKMVTQERSPIEFTMSSYDYMSSMCPGASNSSDKSKGLSKRLLLSFPLEERIKKLLVEGPPLQRFCAIKHFAPDNSCEDLLAVLEQHGQLVQGLWTAQTSALFAPSDGFKRLARGYVLLLFNKGLEIHSSVVRLYPKIQEDMKVILKSFAKERPALGDWKFKEQTDWSFIKQYPHVVEKSKKSYEIAEKSISDFLSKIGKAGPGKRIGTTPNVSNNPEKPSGPDKSAATTASASGTKSSITHETQGGLKKVLVKIFQTHKVCSFQFICQNLRDQAIQMSTLPKVDPRIAKAIASAADAPQEELEEVINEVAVKIHGFYVLKSSPDHPEHDPIRGVVINLLMSGPGAKLKKADIIAAVQHTLKKTISNTEYNKVVTEICESKGAAWVLKSGDGKP